MPASKVQFRIFLFLVSFLSIPNLKAQSLPDLENLEPSTTEAQDFAFYNSAIFLQCTHAPNETRKYSFITKPSADSQGKVVQTLIDITAMVHIDGITGELESHMGDQVLKTEVSKTQTKLILNNGAIALRRNKANGQLHAVMDFEKEKAIQMNCNPTVIVCASVDRTEGKSFYIKLMNTRDGNTVADFVYDFTPEGFSGPLIGHTSLQTRGPINDTAAELKMQGPNQMEGSLKFNWKAKSGFQGDLSFSDPEFKTEMTKVPINCRLGI